MALPIFLTKGPSLLMPQFAHPFVLQSHLCALASICIFQFQKVVILLLALASLRLSWVQRRRLLTRL